MSRRKGTQYQVSGSSAVMALCWFHRERTASLRLWPNGYFRCYGCGETGFIPPSHRIDRLQVLWRSQPIGQLWRVPGIGFRFAYEESLPTEFHLLAEFPEWRGDDHPYESRQLFATFAERIPSPRRPDYGAMMQSWGVNPPYDPFEVLARSGGIQVTDRLELKEWRSPEDERAQLHLPFTSDID